MNLEEEVKKFMDNKNKSMITANAYQEQAKTTAIFPPDKALEYLSLGLAGEAGEVANKVKKIILNYLTKKIQFFFFRIHLLNKKNPTWGFPNFLYDNLNYKIRHPP